MNAENIINNYRELISIAMNVDSIINKYCTMGNSVQARNYVHEYDEYSNELEYNLKFKDGNIELYHMGVHWEELEVDCVCVFPQSYLGMTNEELEVISLDNKAKLEIELAYFLKEKAEKKAATKLRRETILTSVKLNINEVNVRFKEWKGESPKYARKKIVIHDNRIFLEEEGKELECVFIYSKQQEKFISYRNYYNTTEYRFCVKKLVKPIREMLVEVCLEEDHII